MATWYVAHLMRNKIDAVEAERRAEVAEKRAAAAEDKARLLMEILSGKASA